LTVIYNFMPKNLNFFLNLVTSFISTATGKATTTNNGNNNNSRLPPNSSLSQNIGSLPKDSFLRSSISFKQYGYGNNSNKQSTSRHNGFFNSQFLILILKLEILFVYFPKSPQTFCP